MKKLYELKKVLTDINARIESVSRELAMLPEGNISIENRRGIPVPVYTKYENGKRVRSVLTGDIDMQSKLVKASLLSKELKSLEHNKAYITILIENYIPYSLANSLYEIEERLKCDGSELLRHYSEMYDNRFVWASEYIPTNYRASERRQVTSRGLYVRSKSEVLIAEKLYEYNLPFRYEQPIVVSDMTLYPDFTIMREDGKIFYWEHAGLTNSQKYLDWQLRKTQLYASINIFPWDNLIITYDNADGMIDLSIVDSEIKNKLLL